MGCIRRPVNAIFVEDKIGAGEKSCVHEPHEVGFGIVVEDKPSELSCSKNLVHKHEPNR